MNFFVVPTISATDMHRSIAGESLTQTPFGAVGLNGVLSMPCASANSNASEIPQANLALRKRFVSELVTRACHDFHQPSETHLFYAYYSKTSLVRSFHPLRDKAFEFYILLANNLAATNEDGRIEEWLSFIVENSATAEPVTAAPKDYPCSGVVNFKIKTADDALLESLTSQMSFSFGKLSAAVFSDAMPILNDNARRMGLGVQGAEIRRFAESLSDSRQRTVRIDKKIHVNLIAKAHELSVTVGALGSFLFHMYLTKVRSSESSAISFLQL